MNFKLLFSTLMVLCIGFSVSAQKNYYRDANEAFRSEKYFEAIQKAELAYNKITKKGENALKQKGEMAYKAGESYRFTESPVKANQWYEKAILLKYFNTDPELYFNNGEVLRLAGDFEKAKQNYQLYKKLAPADKRVDVALQSVEKVDDIKVNKTRHLIENETKVNTVSFEMAPMFGDKKAKMMYFASSANGSKGGVDPKTGDGFTDIWVSELDNKGNWTKPYTLKNDSINTIHHEGTVCFDGRMKKMFFTRCPLVKKQNLGCDIWMSELKGKDWGNPVKLNLKTNDTISVGHPAVSEDGNFLIFASDMPGGLGGRDLWYSTYDRKSKTWSLPKNMGKGINTAGNELFPTFSKDGSLYFASDGRIGLGGLDIYKASKVGDEDKWENPENMGYPINSESNDYALIEYDDRKGYFTSERKGSVGNEFRPDIWSYVLPPNLYDLTVVVSEFGKKSVKIEGINVSVKGSDGSTFTGITNAAGKVNWSKKTDDSRFVNENATYTIVIDSKKGYKESLKQEKITTVNLPHGQSFYIDMFLIAQRPIRLPEVRYPLAKWNLLVDETINSKDSLNFVYDMLTENPAMVIKLNSHTDTRGNDKYNQVLSENRAKECYRYLVEEKGIDPRRIIPVGKGETTAASLLDENGMVVVDENGNDTKLTDAYINKFKGTPEFERLHGLNRRTDAEVVSMEFDPETAPAAPKEYSTFRALPK